VSRRAFRLQPVLELRRTEERAAAQRAAAAAHEAADADRRASEQEAALGASRLPRSAPGETFLRALFSLQIAAADAAAARALATASADQAAVVRAQWTAAATRTKSLERLRDRHLAALARAEAAAEERAVDDLVTGRHAGARDPFDPDIDPGIEIDTDADTDLSAGPGAAETRGEVAWTA
jgi:flagellar export protein FliJ